MEAWENEPRVRPVPIEHEDGVSLSDAGSSHDRSNPVHARPWLPLVVSGLVVVAVVSAITLFGGVEFHDIPIASPEVFSPTTLVKEGSSSAAVLPPTLEDTIPGIMDRLTLLTTDRRTIWTLLWDPSSRSPRVSVAISDKATSWTAASFDAGGQFVAVLGTLHGERATRDARIGSPTAIDAASRLSDIESLKWHATHVGRLALARAVDNEFLLEVVEIDFLTKTPQHAEVLLVLDEAPNMIRWDNQGFVLQLGTRTVALDSLGNRLWTADGWARTASPGFVSQVRQNEMGVRWYLIDRQTGASTSYGDFGINNNAQVTDIVTSQSSNIFAAVTQRKEAVTITVGGFSLITPKTVYLFEDVSPYQFTSDAVFLILKASDSNDLTFFDWRAGTFHQLDIPDENRVLAINLG